MTENVYVIKVKTKPPLSSLYPSERRYSASTVGGLSLVHAGLGTLSTLLGVVTLSVQGLILSFGCDASFVTGLLAWRRWYIDRNIAIFFYSSLFSLASAVLCFVVTIFNVAATSTSIGDSLWPMQKIHVVSPFIYPVEDFANDTDGTDDVTSPKNNVTEDFLKISESNKSPVTLEPFNIDLNLSDFHDNIKNGNYNDLKTEESFTLEKTMISRETFQNKDTMNITQESTDLMKERTRAFWHNYDPSYAEILLILNLLITSLLEIFWSLLSARIAFRGMMNRLPENGNVVAAPKTMRLPLQKRKQPAPKPDILDHNRRLSETLQNFTNLQSLASPEPRLPLPESSREFRERVERFLANQATHRVIEDA